MKASNKTAWAAALIFVACIAAYLFHAPRALIPDIAWLLEAGRRLVAGQRLYVDILELNPPLAIYEMILFTGGTFAPRVYIAAVCFFVGASACWVLRLQGARAGVAACAAMLLGGLTDFGQREHLALIFVLPFLVGDDASRRERILLGLWAFLGIGLKPFFVLIPLAAVATRAVMERSWKPALAAEIVTLALACCAYLVAVGLLHSEYFTDMIPLASFTYYPYGLGPKPVFMALTPALICTALYPILEKDHARAPVAAAVLAALISFYIQGRNWSYHFVPAIGLGLFLALWIRRRMVMILAALLIGIQLWRGPHHRGRQSPIPEGAESVAFLIAHVYGAWPTSTYCGVTHTTRYPALWPIPGAWNKLTSPDPAVRRKAAQILAEQRAIIRGDLLRQRPQFIFAHDYGKQLYFDRSFNYMRFIGPLPGYRRVGRRRDYDVWSRVGLPGPDCKEQM